MSGRQRIDKLLTKKLEALSCTVSLRVEEARAFTRQYQFRSSFTTPKTGQCKMRVPGTALKCLPSVYLMSPDVTAPDQISKAFPPPYTVFAYC